MPAPGPHAFQIGRWVRLTAGPYIGKRGQIVGRQGRELDLLINGGPLRLLTVDIGSVQQALVDTGVHKDKEVASDSRRGSD
jgi:hypothetical protein